MERSLWRKEGVRNFQRGPHGPLVLEAQAEVIVTLKPCKHVLECASSWLLLRVKEFAESQRVCKYYNMRAHRCGEQISPRNACP